MNRRAARIATEAVCAGIAALIATGGIIAAGWYLGKTELPFWVFLMGMVVVMLAVLWIATYFTFRKDLR